MTKKQKKKRNRIILAVVMYIVAIALDKLIIPDGMPWALISTAIYLVPYITVGTEVFRKAYRNLTTGRLANVFDENFLMFIATVAAFCIGEAVEGVAAMLFYQIGDLFEDYAVNRSRQSIKELMSIMPEHANIEVAGKIIEVDPDDVAVGTTIVVKPGERIPLDGVVLKGRSFVDTSALTGESVYREVAEGEEILSGCINGKGLLYVKTTKEYDDCTVAKILEMVENASSQKAPVENFITKFARYYTPAVVIFAAILAVASPLLFNTGVGEAIRRACIFLVVSCPCALVISVPLSFFGGIGAASRKGILVKGSNFLEALSNLDTIVFDKTGTLTKGSFAVTEVYPAEKRDEILKLAAICEAYSDHPVAQSIRNAYEGMVLVDVVGYQEIPGQGMKVDYNESILLAGNAKLMDAEEVNFEACQKAGTVVYVARDGKFEGWILITDTVKEGVREAVAELHRMGVKRAVMLTGDRAEAAESVASEAGIDQVYSQLLPGDKVEKVKQLMSGLSGNSKLAFVGDGINDAPVIMLSDVGIAMGNLGSDVAIEAADVVLMDDDISKISTLIRIAKKTMNIAKANIVFALGVKFLVLALGAAGIANMWLAIFADVGVSVIAILNAMRTLRI
ncbi:MAG: cadmium-translocating P-type ATPase [Firmicutes bacterium]|nr:cadmium-translocating P-type ATPase [Bacillota bacterium]